MLILPLTTSLLVGIAGRRLGVQGTNIVVIGTLFICALLSLVISNEVILSGSPVSVKAGTWLDTGKTVISWGFTIDPLNAWLISTVLVISLLVHIFASSYMAGDPSPQKFMALLLAFTGFMVLLIAGDNLAVLFFGWEGIGITSYLLIGYWFDRALACSAAGQAIIVNRIGDTMLTLAIVIFISVVGSGTLDLHDINFTFSTIQNLPIIDNFYFKAVGVLLVLAAAGKSAQFLLHTWLPQAMEGPTPVSSLLHAATLVMAGVYLLLRCTSVLNASNIALILAAVLGTITALFAASTAIVQNDIKRVIAYSTCSQFGYMFASVGLSQTYSTVLHLSSHAGFKALLFICAGGVIHSMRDEQDMRRLGGTIGLLPFTYAAILIGSLSLMAMPYLSGNSSKDLILELAAVHVTIPGNFLWMLGSVIAGITACYSIRLLALTFFGEPSAAKSSYSHIHEQPLGLIIPMVTLSIVSIFFGYIAKEPLAGMGSDSIINYFTFSSVNQGTDIPFASLTNNSFGLYTLNSVVEAEFGLGLLVKNLPVICTFIGTFIGILLFIWTPNAVLSLTSSLGSILSSYSRKGSSLLNFREFGYNALSYKWFVDSFYARVVSWPVYQLGLFCSKTVDRGILELIGAQGQSVLANKLNYTLTGPENLISYNELLSLPSTSNGTLNKSISSDFLSSPSFESKGPMSNKGFTNNVPEYALYIGSIAIVLTLCIIGNVFDPSILLILLIASIITLI